MEMCAELLEHLQVVSREAVKRVELMKDDKPDGENEGDAIFCLFIRNLNNSILSDCLNHTVVDNINKWKRFLARQIQKRHLCFR